MTKKNGESGSPSNLRKRAEEKLKKAPKRAELSYADADRENLIQEMEIHQIELEMQNDELKRLRNDAEILAQKYIDVYDFSPIGYLSLDAGGHITMANLAAAQQLCINRKALIGKRFKLWIARPCVTAFDIFFKQSFRTDIAPHPCEFVLDIHTSPKPYRIVEVKADISPSGTELRLALVDITERRQAQEAARIEHLKYRELVQDAASAIIRWEKDGVITFFNEYAQQFFGYSSEEVIGKNINLIIPKRQSDGADLSRLVEDISRDPELYISHVTENIRKDGSRVWMNWTHRPIRNEKGELVEILAVGSDITDVKRAEELLLQKRGQLEDANRELESFSYSVSHDLQAPLRAIEGYSRMILKHNCGQFDEDTVRKFQVIMENVKQMGKLISDLLNFSRLERRDMIVQRVDMSALIREVWQEIVTINPGRALTLKLEELPPCFADRALLKQVISNILGNAAKFTSSRDEAVIEVGFQKQKNEIVYYIRDNGVGFDMNYYDKLFIIFKTLHDRKEYGGTGVGLALAQRIINRHGGRIWAESKINQGSTFYFTIPHHP